ncbi:inositol monophosphatase family protein [Escherichia coli]|jgi:fructose-1,6-bisphosphatase/inositol monophosphatase family enzyme|uniref:inositol monophosphatase family protein n=1 Tax=Pseudomonas sp. ACN8 TaxID=1920428 RepID=UPI000BB2F7AF|nr:inositol monophosphatase family protein [Pseudomonas sp. ACN8]
MKGKRKAKTSKWAMKFQFETEAQRSMSARSEKASNRFLDAALHLGSTHEPIGRLAGASFEPHSKSADLPALLFSVINRVCQAGQLLVTEWQRADGPRGQGDKAVVDVEIEQLLRQQLLDLFFCDFWGEETGHTLTGDSWCWVVDPNDGTNDFLRGLKGSAISVGLLHNHTPMLGVVYAPVTIEGVPDCIAWADGLPTLLRNGKCVALKLPDMIWSSDSCVMLSSAAVNKAETNRELCAPSSFVAMPSIAYRLAKVAAGDGVCGVSVCPTSAHDVVAGHALLRGAGGVLLNENGDSIQYVTQDNMRVVSRRCFGGLETVCRTLAARDWDRIFH